MHELGDKLADMHLSTKHETVHKGRFGFVADNFLSRTPVANEWEDDWHVFFAQRLKAQLDLAFVDKVCADRTCAQKRTTNSHDAQAHALKHMYIRAH
jgi:fructosamine-3-kinase